MKAFLIRLNEDGPGVAMLAKHLIVAFQNRSMGDDDMYDKFEVSDWDLQNEFNPRRFKKMSKSKAIYGKLTSLIFVCECIFLTLNHSTLARHLRQ